MTIAVLKKSILAENDRAAEQTRRLLDEHNIAAFNIMGGAGCGKTTLLEHVIPMLKGHLKVAVLEGDLATTKDAARIDALGVPVVQLLTEGGCHLTATLVNEALKELSLADIDLLLIENVGNPICPASFDLGEHERIAVLSVTEGDDKPAKYPYLFKVADVVVITKMDLLEVTDFDADHATVDIHILDPGKPVMRISATKTGAGPVSDWLRERCRAIVQSA